DDLLWLPYSVAHYVEKTGDTAILDEEIPFIEGAPLADGEHERMFVPAVSRQAAPLWDHCRRAIERASRFGPRDLPLFGGGDWNDGMNLVGVEGKGESVWMGWFLCAAYRMFAPLLEDKSPTEAALLGQRASALAQALDKSCWDGEWYLRGFFDSGEPLGSHVNPEARIDSLPQS